MKGEDLDKMHSDMMREREIPTHLNWDHLKESPKCKCKICQMRLEFEDSND